MAMNWLQADWPAPDYIKAGTTFRQGGSSKAPYNSLNIAMHVGDEPSLVDRNRTKLDINSAPQWLEQVHSTEVVLLPNEIPTPKADAAYTTKLNVVCAVLTADCLPLLITDKKGSTVAAIHAGWRGLCNGIIENTLDSLQIRADSVLVWLGPAISADVYEVGKEVYDAFTLNDENAKQSFTSVSEQHWLFDLYKLAALRLNRLGVHQIYGGSRCTFTEKKHFFSYRRDGITGRMASMIWIDN